MRRLLIILAALILSAWLGIVLMKYPGMIYIVTQRWTVTLPLWFGALATAIILLLFYAVLSLVHKLGFSWYRWKMWWHSRGEHRAYSKTQQAWLAMIEHKWPQAEKLFIDGVAQSPEPLMNYLGAAEAANAQGAADRCDKYLQQAHHISPRAETPIGIVRAEFQLKSDQLEQALATLGQLRQVAPKQAYVLSLLERVYTRLADWKALLNLLPALRKTGVLTKDQAIQMEKNIYSEQLRSLTTPSLAALQNLWNSIPRSFQYNADVTYEYVNQLQRYSVENATADALIRGVLKKQWHAGLVRIYGLLLLPDPAKQLAVAEAWLKRYGQQPTLLITLARLAMRAQLWGKARDYYEKGLALEVDADAGLEYGKLLEKFETRRG